MADNKNIIYKREVSRITLQESHSRLTNPGKCKSEKSIMEEEGNYPQTSFYFQDKTSKIIHTDKSVTHKTSLGIERNNNKVEFKCDICGIVCTGMDNFKLHIEGKKHSKKIKEQKILQQMGSISRNIQIPTIINCDMCEKRSVNLEAYLRLRKDDAHQEISPLYGTMKTKKLEDPFQFSEDARRTTYSTHCGVCKMWFKNTMAYDLHIETIEHLRKGRILKELVEVKDAKITSEEGQKLTCETCGKAFNGPAPFKQHLLSDSHSKKDDIAMGMMRMNILRASELHCKDCGKKFSGVVPLDAHLRGSAHKRQIKKNNLLKNLEEEHPEVLDYSMFGIHGEDAKREGDVKLHCDTCHLGFRKTEDVQEHFTSVQHREATKVQVKTLQDFIKIVQERESLTEETPARLSESEDSSDDPLIEL